MSSGPDRDAAKLAARLGSLADGGNGVRRAADRAAGGLAPDDLCESVDALADLIGSVYLVLRNLLMRAEGVRGEYLAAEGERRRAAGAGASGVTAMDTALLNMGLGYGALEAVHHLLLTGRGALWEAVTAEEKATQEEGGG